MLQRITRVDQTRRIFLIEPVDNLLVFFVPTTNGFLRISVLFFKSVQLRVRVDFEKLEGHLINLRFEGYAELESIEVIGKPATFG